MSTLVREEINLARVEVTSSVSQLSRGAVMAAAGGVLLFAGFLVLLAAATFALIDAGMDPWLASLVVAAAVLLVGGVVTWMGINQIRRPPSWHHGRRSRPFARTSSSSRSR